MTDYFKTIRAYLRGKWGRKRVSESERIAQVVRDEQTFWGPFDNEWIDIIEKEHDVHSLMLEIARLRRNKKKHSHLQKQLDDLLNGGAQISDQQTETTK